jgi:hypothetical protein
VLDTQHLHTGLFELVGRRLNPEAVPRIQVRGEGSLARPGLVVLSSLDADTGRSQPLDSMNLELEGISTGPFEFFGPLGLLPDDSAIESYNAPRATTTPPGIVADRLRVAW